MDTSHIYTYELLPDDHVIENVKEYVYCNKSFDINNLSSTLIFKLGNRTFIGKTVLQFMITCPVLKLYKRTENPLFPKEKRVYPYGY